MTGSGSPARQFLLLLEDEAALADLPITEVMDDLAALGIDPAASIARARSRVDARNSPHPSEVRVELAPGTEKERDKAAEPPPGLTADMRIRAGGASDILERKSRRRGGLAWTAAGALAAMVVTAVAVLKYWPEILILDSPARIAAPGTDQPVPEANEPPAEATAEVAVSRLEPVPAPASPEPAAEPRREPEPAPAPPPRTVEPAPSVQPSTSTGPGAPRNIVPRPEPPVVEEARLPGDVARPFTAPPTIVAIVPVEPELLAELETGFLSAGSRSGSGPRADQSRLTARVDDARRIAAGRAIAALVTVRVADDSYDAMIVRRPEAEEDRTIADAEPALIPILGDSAHLFDLVRLSPP